MPTKFWILGLSLATYFGGGQDAKVALWEMLDPEFLELDPY